MWYYQKANTDHTRNAIEQFTWDRSFKTLDLNEIVFSCNRIIKNILSDYISSAITEIHCGLIIDSRLINEKNHAFESYLHNNKDPQLLDKVEYR